MIRRLKRLNQTGDTIVEVLIVLAVLGLALSIAYATANRGLQQSRNAQEHSQALGVINSQVELLRSAFAKQAGTAIEAQGGAAGGPFCLSTSGPNVDIKPLANSGPEQFNENLAADKLGNTTVYPGPCLQDDLYNISIVPRGNGVYDFRVRWEGVGNLGRQQEEITYKIGNVIASPSGGYTDPELPPPPEAPVFTLSFEASPTTVRKGQSLTLRWSTTPAAESCAASGDWSDSVKPGGLGVNGNTEITVPSNTLATTLTYTLTCRSGTTSVSQTVTVNVIAAQNLVPLYRLFSLWVIDHLYSTDASEGRENLYTLQGDVGMVDTVQGPGEVPLYRLYSPSQTDHFYTTSKQEADLAVAVYGYQSQGIVGYIMPYGVITNDNNGRDTDILTLGCPTGTTPLYRMYSSYLTDHFYTTNFNEYYWGNDFSSIFAGFSWYNYPEGITGCTFTSTDKNGRGLDRTNEQKDTRKTETD